IMPHAAHLRPPWMIRAGLFLYDHLARRTRLAASSSIDLRRHIAGEPLKESYRRGFVYSDVQTDDARLVVLNALDARSRGATILTRTRCERLTAQHGTWSARLAAADDQRPGRSRGRPRGSDLPVHARQPLLPPADRGRGRRVELRRRPAAACR